MALIDFIKKMFKNSTEQAPKRYSGSDIYLHSGGYGSIYGSDFINNAIFRISNEISKAQIVSVVDRDGSESICSDSLSRLFRFMPNRYQSTGDFLATVVWLYYKTGNAFIYPEYELVDSASGPIKKFISVYAINPQSYKIYQDSDKIKFVFYDSDSGQTSEMYLRYSDIIHMKWRRGINSLVGGDDSGRVGVQETAQVLDSLTTTIKSLPEAIKASTQIKGLLSIDSPADAEKLKKEGKSFEDLISYSETGIAVVGIGSAFTPVRINPAEVPAETLNFLKSFVCERYGVSMKILSGTYTSEDYSAFYNSVIEPFIREFDRRASAVCFSQREQDCGHRIKTSVERIQYYSTTEKIEMTKLATSTALYSINEIRAWFGSKPTDDGNRLIQSLNYVDSSLAEQYQTTSSAGKE